MCFVIDFFVFFMMWFPSEVSIAIFACMKQAVFVGPALLFSLHLKFQLLYPDSSELVSWHTISIGYVMLKHFSLIGK